MKTYITLIMLLITANLIGCSSAVTKPESSGEHTSTLQTESQTARAKAKVEKYFGKTTSQGKKLVKQSNPSSVYSGNQSATDSTPLDFLAADTDEQCNTLFSSTATVELNPAVLKPKARSPIQLTIRPTNLRVAAITKATTRSNSRPSAKVDLWCRLREGYKLGAVDNSYVQRAIDKYVRSPDDFEQMLNRARPYLYHIVEKVERRGLPLEIALLPALESRFEPLATSPKSAAGIWQFVPETGRDYGLEQTQWYDGRRDFIAATGAALDYLEKLFDIFGDDWLIALAAYNYGEGNVRKAIKKNEAQGLPTDFWSLDLPNETRWYVPKLLALAKIVNNPQDYGIKLQVIPDRPYVQQVQVKGQISLSLAANLAGLSTTEFTRLNAGYHLGMTGPDGTQNLTVPIRQASLLKQRLAKMTTPTTPILPYSGLEEISQWRNDSTLASFSNLAPGWSIMVSAPPAPVATERTQLHRVSKGETLERIAQQYSTSISKLRQLNPLLQGDLVKIGALLIVPTATQNVSVKTQKGGMIRTPKFTNEPLSTTTPVKVGSNIQGS